MPKTQVNGYFVGQACACGGTVRMIPATVPVTRTDALGIAHEGFDSIEVLACVGGECNRTFALAL